MSLPTSDRPTSSSPATSHGRGAGPPHEAVDALSGCTIWNDVDSQGSYPLLRYATSSRNAPTPARDPATSASRRDQRPTSHSTTPAPATPKTPSPERRRLQTHRPPSRPGTTASRGTKWERCLCHGERGTTLLVLLSDRGLRPEHRAPALGGHLHGSGPPTRLRPGRGHDSGWRSRVRNRPELRANRFRLRNDRVSSLNGRSGRLGIRTRHNHSPRVRALTPRVRRLLRPARGSRMGLPPRTRRSNVR